IDKETVGHSNPGILVLLGVTQSDTETEARWLADKIVGLRIFNDEEGKMNRALADVQGSMLIVSQFTLYGDCRKGRRPSFIEAAPPEKADALYRRVVAEVRGQGIHVETGKFQAQMEVALVNDGPVTLLIDSRKGF